jgi:hypothetical protein
MLRCNTSHAWRSTLLLLLLMMMMMLCYLLLQVPGC